MICSISGELTVEPVVSIKSGYIYEKRLIEKYIDTNGGREPKTNQPLSLNDLVVIKQSGGDSTTAATNGHSSNQNNSSSSSSVKPRVGTTTSIPGMLQMFQNEWDSLMLETFTLKQQFESVRQELAQSLYQYDAACRVIARLIKERDTAKSALANAPIKYNTNNQSNNNNDEMMIDTRLPVQIQESIENHTQLLFQQRKKRSKPTNLPTTQDVAQFEQLISITSQHPGGLTSCDSLNSSPSTIVVGSGGNGGEITLFDTDKGDTAQTLFQGHTKAICKVLFNQYQPDLLLSSGKDRTIRAWNVKNGKQLSMAKSNQDIASIDVHPLSIYFNSISGGLDRSWSIYDLATMKQLVNVSGGNSGGRSGVYTCGKFHPDGSILGIGGDDGTIGLWDVKESKNVVTLLDDTKSSVKSLSFSENGYFAASCDSNNTVKVWDLRKSIAIQTINIASGGLKSISFDHSGSYLAVAGLGISIYHLSGKTNFTEVKQLDSSTQYNDLKWSMDSQNILSITQEGLIKLWGTQ